jgi:hypothetical protein
LPLAQLIGHAHRMLEAAAGGYSAKVTFLRGTLFLSDRRVSPAGGLLCRGLNLRGELCRQKESRQAARALV